MIQELAAGVIVAGFDGTVIPQSERLDFAGYLFFARNIETLAQTRSLNDALRARYPSNMPPILAIDQEGGRVVRLRDGVRPIPPAAELGQRGDPRECFATGAYVAQDVRAAGFTVNFAPVLDLAVDARNTVIGDRSFGADPLRVTELAGAFARGMHENDIMPVFKHFPGHGSTATDSHVDLPRIDLAEKVFRSRDLVPFARLLPATEYAVMAGHVVVHAFDRENPATLSPTFLTEILREELGFTGVCFTDCLQMDAIARTVGTVEAAPRAIAAGADCIVISRGLDVADACAKSIEQAVEMNTLPLPRLKEAYERVRALRAAF